MSILSWITFGLIVGILANFLSKKPSAENLIGTIMLGVLGSVLGGLLGNLIFRGGIAGLNLIPFAIAAASGIVLLAVDRAFQRR